LILQLDLDSPGRPDLPETKRPTSHPSVRFRCAAWGPDAGRRSP
jgi:hypothetical protein